MSKFIDNLLTYKYMNMRVISAWCVLDKHSNHHWEADHMPSYQFDINHKFKLETWFEQVYRFNKKDSKSIPSYLEVGNTLTKKGICKFPPRIYYSKQTDKLTVIFNLLALDSDKARRVNYATYEMLKRIVEKGDKAVEEYIESLKQRRLLINYKGNIVI